MQLIVNGENTELKSGTTISDLLSQLDLPSTRVAVEVNKDLVRRAEHPAHQLKEGDHIEIVTFVGGGN